MIFSSVYTYIVISFAVAMAYLFKVGYGLMSRELKRGIDAVKDKVAGLVKTQRASKSRLQALEDEQGVMMVQADVVVGKASIKARKIRDESKALTLELVRKKRAECAAELRGAEAGLCLKLQQECAAAVSREVRKRLEERADDKKFQGESVDNSITLLSRLL